MKKVVNFLRGSVEVEAQGAFPERFLNLCAQRGVSFWGVEWVESTAVGRMEHSTPMAEIIGRATVREHLPKQEMSCRLTIRFIVSTSFASFDCIVPEQLT